MTARIYNYTNDVPDFIARSEEGFPKAPRNGSKVYFIDTKTTYTYYGGSWYDSDGKRIESELKGATLKIGDDTYRGRITDTAVVFVVPSGTVITALTPTMTASPGATVAPTTAQDFTTPVTYTVTAEDATNETEYTVSVEVETD